MGKRFLSAHGGVRRRDGGGRIRDRFDSDFLPSLAQFSSGRQFLSGRHIEQSIPGITLPEG